MKKQLYESRFTKIYYSREDELFEVIRPVPSDISDEKFKSEFLQWKDLVLKYRPKRQLIDNREYAYIIAPDMQEWVDKNVLAPSVKAGLKRVAFLLPSDIFSETSIAQTMEENAGRALKIMYFNDYNEAVDWLLEKPEVIEKYARRI